MIKQLLRVFRHVVLISLILVLGCNRKQEQVSQESIPDRQESEGGILTLYNWEEYIGSKTLKNFEKETGIHVQETYFDDEEEMLGAVQSDLSAYDLVVTSEDTLREMRKAKMLAPLDYAKITNIRYIDEKYLNASWDPEQKYTVPYLFGTTGMVVNKKYIKEDQDSWQVLFDPRYRGKLAMLNNPFEVTAAAAKLLGYSINTTDPGELAKVRDLLYKQKPLLKGYHDVITIRNMLINEELWAAHMYSGEGLSAVDENKNLDYVIPREGAPIWVDCFVMPRDAKHRQEAHLFLNYILRPELNASIASELWYATPNKAAVSLMDPEVVESPSVYPPAEIIERCEHFIDIGESTLIIAVMWDELLRED